MARFSFKRVLGGIEAYGPTWKTTSANGTEIQVRQEWFRNGGLRWVASGGGAKAIAATRESATRDCARRLVNVLVIA